MPTISTPPEHQGLILDLVEAALAAYPEPARVDFEPVPNGEALIYKIKLFPPTRKYSIFPGTSLNLSPLYAALPRWVMRLMEAKDQRVTFRCIHPELRKTLCQAALQLYLEPLATEVRPLPFARTVPAPLLWERL